jgi:uncharacterized damage-inducible protein DinB
MFNVNGLTDLYRHMEWADASVWTAVLASEEAMADKKLRDYFYHLHMVQYAFLRVWRNEPRETPFPKFDETQPLRKWGQACYSEGFAYLQSVADAALAEPKPVPWAVMVEPRLGRKPEMTTLGDTLLQAAMHSQYHRGQVNARLKELGGDPPLVDFIVWVWLGRPAPVWPPAQSL